MVYLIWLATLVISFYAGYRLRDLTRKIEAVQEVLKDKVDRKPVETEPQSILIDLDDPIKEAQYVRDQLMKKLNPHE